MPLVQPAPGMTYDFKADGVFAFNDSVTFLGMPSVSYLRLFPVKAQVIADGVLYANVSITADRTTGTSGKSAIVTYDKIDVEPIKDKNVVLHCIF